MKFLLSLFQILANQNGNIRLGFQRSFPMNEAGDIDAGGGGGSHDGDIEWDDEDDGGDEDVFNDDPSDLMTELGLDPNKYALDDEDKTEKESEEKETQPSAGQTTDEKSLIEKLNSLGAVHNELPIKIESLEQVKELVQKGHDYTQKTQALSTERKEWELEKTQTETELNAAIKEFNDAQEAHSKQIQELEQWVFTINQLKENAPDVFEEVQRAYDGVVKQFSNPVLDKQLAAIRAELAETKKSLSSRENKLIVEEFDREWSAMSATEQSLKELGITVNKEEVKKEWAATGMPVKKVVGSLYFEAIAKAQASKSKVETTRQKVSAKPAGAAGASRQGSKVPQVDRNLSYFEQAKQLLNNYKD